MGDCRLIVGQYRIDPCRLRAGLGIGEKAALVRSATGTVIAAGFKVGKLTREREACLAGPNILHIAVELDRFHEGLDNPIKAGFPDSSMMRWLR